MTTAKKTTAKKTTTKPAAPLAAVEIPQSAPGLAATIGHLQKRGKAIDPSDRAALSGLLRDLATFVDETPAGLTIAVNGVGMNPQRCVMATFGIGNPGVTATQIRKTIREANA